MSMLLTMRTCESLGSSLQLSHAFCQCVVTIFSLLSIDLLWVCMYVCVCVCTFITYTYVQCSFNAVLIIADSSICRDGSAQMRPSFVAMTYSYISLTEMY